MTKTKSTKTKSKRTVNYHSRSRASTLAKQNLVLAHIATQGDGLTVVEVAALLGCSRQLALYHVKKMVATSQLVMVLEPCRENGGVRFRCWDVTTLARRMASVLSSYRAEAA